jgi:hypothetical protein
MSRLAIVSWYLEYQNAPSKPDKELIIIPEDETKRDELLRAQYVAECGPEVTLADVTVEETEEYGDLQVSHDGTHMFVTYAVLPNGWSGPG